MEEKIQVELDATNALNTLQQVENARQNTVNALNATLSMARSAYMGIAAIVRIGGGTISTLFSAVISAGISMIQILTPLITAKLAGQIINPFEWAKAGLALYNLGIATAAIMAAESQQTELASKLHSANALMHAAQMFIGTIGTLW